MTLRLQFGKVCPDGYKILLGLKKYLDGSSLDERLHKLIEIRASMSNGCAYCVDTHFREAIAIEESPRRLISLSTWQEAACFSERERAVLAFTDEVTAMGPDGVSDPTWEALETFFSQEEVADILLAIVTINSFNRLAVTTHMVPAGAPGLIPEDSAAPAQATV